ncbi:MAG TPA: hypothetical protein VGB19_10875 [Actinomycetota bacterium]
MEADGPERTEGDEEGRDDRPRASIPITAMAISLAVAVAAVSVLIFVLFKKTTGPGQVVRDYYEAVSDRDCDGAYHLLSRPVRSELTHDRFCRAVRGLKDLPTGVQIETVTGCGEPPARFARVEVRELGSGAALANVRWQMVREGGSWRVAGFPANRLPVPDAPTGIPDAPEACAAVS